MQPKPPAAPALEPSELDDEIRIGEMLPPWLTSLVTHLILVLVLALITAGSPGGNSGVLLNCDLGDSGSADGQGLLDDALLNGSELTSTLVAASDASETQQQAIESLLEPADLSATLELPNPLDALAAGIVKQGENGKDGGDDGQGDGSGGSKGDGGGGQGLLPVSTQVFGLKSEGTRFVYVFDRSESMNSIVTYSVEGSARRSITPLEAAKAELLRSLSDLTPKQQFQIVFYNHAPLVFWKTSTKARLLPATTETKRRATSFVEWMPGEGNTHHMEPLQIALSMHPDVIYLLTDGEAKDDLWEQQFDQIRRANKGHARIHVIQFGLEPTSQSTLKQLAEQNGGEYLYLNIARLAGYRGPDLPAATLDPGEAAKPLSDLP